MKPNTQFHGMIAECSGRHQQTPLFHGQSTVLQHGRRRSTEPGRNVQNSILRWSGFPAVIDGRAGDVVTLLRGTQCTCFGGEFVMEIRQL